MVASMFRTRVTTRQVYALGALAAVLFGYDNGIIGAALLFIPRDLPLTPWQKGAVVSATVFGAMGRAGSGSCWLPGWCSPLELWVPASRRPSTC
jgi:hypothetical protein